MRNKCFLIIFYSIVSLSLLSVEAKKCRALVLEGGGDKGAWQAGALTQLIETLDPEEVQYDIVSGVSIGSINGFLFSTYAQGDEKAFVQEVLDIWRNFKSEDAFNYWDDHRLETLRGFYDKPSFFDNSAFAKFIAKYVEAKTLKRKLSVGVTDASTAESKFYIANDLSKENLEKILLASTSMPVMFPYVRYEDTILIDGGVLLNADVRGAILRCKELVQNDEDIIIDTILPHGATVQYMDPNQNYTAMQMYSRYKELSDFKYKLTDYFHAYYDHPNVNWRYTIMPLEDLPSDKIPIFFSQETLQKMITMGQDHAKKIIADPNLTDLGRLSKQKHPEGGDGKRKSFLS